MGRNKKARTIRSLTFHSLRHSFNSEMANAGVREELRMKLTGHATREQHQKYTHHELGPLRERLIKCHRLPDKNDSVSDKRAC
jgi:integrase